MFSVVVPLYNKANYVKKSIQSVLNQTSQDFEVIVIDDGSTDGGLEIVKQIADVRMKIIQQPNQGVSVARNSGVGYASYEYITFLDADDWWHPTFLEEMKALIISHSDAALFGSSYFIVKNQQNQRAKIGLDEGYAGYIDYFKVYASTFWVPINCSFVVVKKSVFEALGGFKPALKFGEDFDLWVRIALEYQVAYMNKCLAFSNQDVEVSNRALGNGKNWQMHEHVLFNLDYLTAYTKQNNSLKRLMDGLNVRGLVDFYMNGVYTSEVQALLRQVDFAQQSFLYRFIYHWPKPIVKVFFLLKYFGSKAKQEIIRIKNQ